jgi:hypothetical protein
MKKVLYWIISICLIGSSCQNDGVERVFEKSADERVADAKASLKADLTAPANGWRLNYKPEDGSGSFVVILKFNQDNTVNILSDLAVNNGEFQNKTITYRIDSSLGLELVMENYSFFSYLFEQDQATFGAEFEFNYVNKTSDNALVFQSKTDPGNPTILLFQEATTADKTIVTKGGVTARNVNIMAQDFETFSSSYKITYDTRDLILYFSLDESKRVITFGSASKKTNTAQSSRITFSTGYSIRGDSLVLATALTGSFQSVSTNLKSILLKNFSTGSISICADPITTHAYTGTTNTNLPVIVETTLQNTTGKYFTSSQYYFCPLNNIRDNGQVVTSQITADIEGALQVDLYYNAQLQNGTRLYGLGFIIQNKDKSYTYAYKKFTPVLTDNKITFNFEPGIFFLINPTTDADTSKIDKYIDALTEGDNTYILKYADDLYEFHNPCTGWSFVFVNGN